MPNVRTWGTLGLALLLGGCGAISMVMPSQEDKFRADAASKGRPWGGETLVTINHSQTTANPEGPSQYFTNGDIKAGSEGKNYKIRGWATSYKANVQGTGGLQYVDRYFLDGRFASWYKHPDGVNRGSLESDGWMSAYVPDKIIRSYKVADWRYYNREAQVTEEGVYKAVADKDNDGNRINTSKKDGVWKVYDYANLKVKTETYAEGRLNSTGSEAWPDFSDIVGRYKLSQWGQDELIGQLYKDGRFVIEKSVGSHAVGTTFWLHRSPYFNGDIIVLNFYGPGGLCRWTFNNSGFNSQAYWPHNYPYDTQVPESAVASKL